LRGRRDPLPMLADAELAEDCALYWADLSIGFRGRQQIAAMRAELLRAIPDLEVRELEVPDTGASKTDVLMQWAGTQVHCFHQMFPVGIAVRWLVRASITSDRSGRASQIDLRFEVGLETLQEAANIDGVSQSALLLAGTPTGSRILQEAVQAAPSERQRAALIAPLRGHVWELAASPHGNHVLQQCVVALPASQVRFIAEELRGRAVEAAQHNTVSRVLERLLEHCPQENTTSLVDELLRAVPKLSKHAFGNFVIQRLLDHGTPQQRHRIAEALLPKVCQLARHRQANNVVRNLLVQASPGDRQRLVQALAADPRGLAGLSRHIAGSFVARELRQSGLLGAEDADEGGHRASPGFESWSA